MINALRAEIRRLLSRRIVAVALLGLLALVGLYQLQVNSQVSPPSAAQVAEIQREYDEYLKEWEANHEEWEAECLDSGGGASECAQPRPDPSEWGLAPLAFEDAVGPAVSFGIYLGGMVLFVATASFIGAEITSGSLANWLTFVPDRRIVLISKLVVVSVFSVVVGAAVGFLTVGLSSLVTTIHGQPLTGLAAMSAMAARGTVVVAVFGIGGFLVGMLTGSTGASIGVLLAAFFLTYVQSALAFMARWAQHLSPWTFGVNLQAILNAGTTYQVSTGTSPPLDDSFDGAYVEKTVSLAQGLGYWTVVLAVLAAVTWLLFRRRDVT